MLAWGLTHQVVFIGCHFEQLMALSHVCMYVCMYIYICICMYVFFPKVGCLERLFGVVLAYGSGFISKVVDLHVGAFVTCLLLWVRCGRGFFFTQPRRCHGLW